jgi:hypothetical protein
MLTLRKVVPDAGMVREAVADGDASVSEKVVTYTVAPASSVTRHSYT